MAPNHLTKLAASSCSSINVRTTYPPRPAYPEDGIKHESLDYETNNDLIISNYASNCMIGDANSDQSPSGNASNCDQKQVGTNQAGDYSTGISAATDRYIGAQACVGDAGAISCKRDHAERHAISRREMCLAADPGGDQHSSSGAGMCAAASAEAPEIAIAKYNGSSAAVKAEVGYTDTAASGKCRSGGSTAAGANNAGESTSDAGAAAGKMSRRKKFVGVRQRPSGRWVAEIKDTTQKIRMWLGTFDTAEDAARAYDEAACLLRGSNTRTNFMPLQAPPSPSPSPLASRLAHMLRARQNRDVRLQSSSPSSPPRATAAIERGPRHPLRFSLSPTSPLSSSVYSHNRTPVQSTDSISAKRYPDCIDTSQNANPHTNHVLHNSFRSPCIRKTYGNQQDAYMSNQGSGLHLLHPHTAAHNSTLWGSSKGESGSSDSDFSPPHADYFRLHKRHRMHLQDCSHSLSMYKAGFTTADGCNKSAHGMPGTYLGKEILGELPCTHPGPANEDMDWDERKQIFASDKNIISAEDIHTLTRDPQSMRGNDSYHHNYGEGGFMEALMAGIKDDMTMDSSSAYDYNTTQTVCPFDFSVEAPMAASSMIKMDEFPLINELSGKLEEAEGGLHYVNAHEEKEGSNHGSSSNGMLEGTHHSLESGTNSDLEMKRMRFERIDSASLYALNGVHEMAIKQLTPSLHPGTNYVAGNSTSTSFNFLSNSPSYLLSSPWKPWSALSVSISTACSDAVPVNASSITGAFINRPSSNPSHNCPSDSIASNNNSTHTSPNIGSETINIGPASSGTSNISTDAQSQEAAMWNSWDLAPLCPLVA